MLCLALLCGLLVLFPRWASGQQAGDAQLGRAIELQRAGQLDEAVAAYEAILQRQPRNFLAHANLGAALAAQGRLNDAIAHYQTVLAADESNIPVLYNLALAQYKLSRLKDAAHSFEALLRRQPGNQNAMLLLGDCYLRFDENKKVIALLEPLSQVEGDNRALWYVLGTAFIRDGQVDKGQALIDRILRHGDTAEAHVLLGTARLLANDYPGAVKELAQAVALNPALPAAYGLYGRALMASGERDRAADAFRRELQLNPYDFDANLHSGVLAKQDQKFDEAEAFFKRALEVRPGTPDVRYQLATIYQSTGRVPEAQEILEKLVQEAPDFLEAHVSLATLYYRLKRKEDGERERRIVEKLNAEIQAKQPGVKQEAGQATPAASFPEHDAKPKATEAGVATPKPAADESAKSGDFDALAKRAEEARTANRSDDAVKAYWQALQLKPDWAQGWWYLGSLYYTSQRYEQGRNAYRRLTEVTPKAGAAWGMLGLCEFGLTDYVPAFEHMQHARELGLERGTQLSHVVRYHIALLFNLYKQPDAALQVLYTLARDEDENAALVQAMGIAALRLPVLPQALPPAQADLALLLGRAHYSIGSRNVARAQEQLFEALKRYPDTPNVHYNYGVFLLASQPDRAIEQFKKELAIAPGHLAARLQLAFEYLRRKDVDAGLPFAREAVAMAPESFVAHNALGRLLLDKGDVDNAIRELEAGLKLEPASAEAAFALARAYAKAGRKEDAERARADFERLDKIRRAQTEGHAAGSGNAASATR